MVGDAPVEHWESIYGQRLADDLRWYQAEPTVSLGLIGSLGLGADQAIVDVGGGASMLVDCLSARGCTDLSVVDISARALACSKVRLGDRAGSISWLRRDVLAWAPERRYALWHDRAVFHFLTTDRDRDRYLATLKAALMPSGYVVVGTFADDGPERCSGLAVHRYGPEELARVFGDGFEVLAKRREIHHTPRGVPQPFNWLVLSATGGPRLSPAV